MVEMERRGSGVDIVIWTHLIGVATKVDGLFVLYLETFDVVLKSFKSLKAHMRTSSCSVHFSVHIVRYKR